MSKKKSKQLPITEVQLTPEQIAQAKEILAGLQKDIQYAAAKKNLVRMMLPQRPASYRALGVRAT